MKELMAWISQPSTVRGIIQMASVVGITVAPAHVIAIITAGGGLVALANLIKKDDSKFK